MVKNNKPDVKDLYVLFLTDGEDGNTNQTKSVSEELNKILKK